MCVYVNLEDCQNAYNGYLWIIELTDAFSIFFSFYALSSISIMGVIYVTFKVSIISYGGEYHYTSKTNMVVFVVFLFLGV